MEKSTLTRSTLRRMPWRGFMIPVSLVLAGVLLVLGFSLVSAASGGSGDMQAGKAPGVMPNETIKKVATYTYTGTVTAIYTDTTPMTWTIGTKTFLVYPDVTKIEAGIVISNVVVVNYVPLLDGSLVALDIRLLGAEEVPIVITPTVAITECTGAIPHPKAVKLAKALAKEFPDKYASLTADDLMFWFCQGFGFGEIEQAYKLSAISGKDPAEVFAMRFFQHLGWGQIKQELGKVNNKPLEPNGQTKKMGPQNGNKPENPGKKPESPPGQKKKP